jgi:hypothetical protein
MKKTFLITFLLSVIFNWQSYSQATIEGLQGNNWNLSATQFSDGSYVVSSQHSSEQSRIIFLDKDGNKTLSKIVDKKEDWTFGDRPFKRFKGGMIVPVIDKEKKICYNLSGNDGQLSVTIVNEKLESETVIIEEKIYKKFYWLNEYTPPVSLIDSEGNPIWAITENRRGILYVKYNIQTKKIENKFFEHEGYSEIVKGYDFISASVIGFKDDKFWYAQITDRGHKTGICKVTLYSIDKNLNLKSEKEFKLEIPDNQIAINIASVNQQSETWNDKMVFTLNTIKANNGGPIEQLWFISFDGAEVQSVAWNNTKGTSIYYSEMLVSDSENGQFRFVIGDKSGDAVAWDVDFNEKKVIGIKVLQNMSQDPKDNTPNQQTDKWIYSILLYELLLADDIKNGLGDYKAIGNTPLIFQGQNGSFFVIKGHYLENKVTFKINI